MRNRLSTLLAAAALSAFPLIAQGNDCVGDGGAILEIESVNSTVIGPGSDILLKLRGTPNGCYCLVCDIATGVTTLPIVGEFCAALTPHALVSVGFFNSNGEFDWPVTLPSSPIFNETPFCCVFLDTPIPINLTSIRSSNRVCICQGFGCEDKIRSLQLTTTLPYSGAGAFTVGATARKDDDNGDLIGQTSFSFDPANPPALPFSADGQLTVENVSIFGNEAVVLFRIDADNFNNDGVLPSRTWFEVSAGNATNSQEIHTSCSQDIGVGFVFGDFTITDLFDPTKNDQCRNGRKPGDLCLRYTGADCSVTTHNQDPSKVQCSGDPAMAPQVWIRASDDDDPSNSGARVWFEGPVNLDEVFEINASNGGRRELTSRTYVHVLSGPGGSVLQFLEFHTSCSQPLQLGDRFGSLTLECFRDPDDGNLCAGNKPAILTMAYEGSGCAATQHAQDPSKVSCAGDPMSAPQVYILSTDKSDPNDTGARVWFQGTVSLNSSFAIDAANASESRLENATFVHIFDQLGGTLLQSVEFHTSCSQPLRVGDQFGAVRLTNFVPE